MVLFLILIITSTFSLSAMNEKEPESISEKLIQEYERRCKCNEDKESIRLKAVQNASNIEIRLAQIGKNRYLLVEAQRNYAGYKYQEKDNDLNNMLFNALQTSLFDNASSVPCIDRNTRYMITYKGRFNPTTARHEITKEIVLLVFFE